MARSWAPVLRWPLDTCRVEEWPCLGARTSPRSPLTAQLTSQVFLALVSMS